MAADCELAILCFLPKVRPLNPRERDEGLRACVNFDEETRQVVLSVSDGVAGLPARAEMA